MWTIADKIILVAIAVIFIVLLMLINKLNAFMENSNETAVTTMPVPAPKAAPAFSSGIATETVAAISAAVAMCMEESAPGVPYKIASINRRVTSGRRPVWGFAGMRQNTEPF